MRGSGIEYPQTFEFVLVRRKEIRFAFEDLTVTGGASTEAATSMLDGDIIRQSDVEQRFAFPRMNFDSGGHELDLRHGILPGQVEKLDPQPQVLLAFGLLNTKPFPFSPPEKSSSVPLRYKRDF